MRMRFQPVPPLFRPTHAYNYQQGKIKVFMRVALPPPTCGRLTRALIAQAWNDNTTKEPKSVLKIEPIRSGLKIYITLFHECTRHAERLFLSAD